MWRIDYNMTDNSSAALAISGVTGMVVTIEYGHLGSEHTKQGGKPILFMSYRPLVLIHWES
jgi:hypothetical protein